jgi:Fic family protein
LDPPQQGRHGRQARVGLGDLREEHISRQGFFGPVAMIYREHGRPDRSSYYRSLERTQKNDLDATERPLWFVECFSRMLDAAELACANVLSKAEFWHRHAPAPLNERQRTILNRLLDGFEGKLTARKWVAIAKCSTATAQRDIKDLVDRAILMRNEGGSKNTSYSLAMPLSTE